MKSKLLISICLTFTLMGVSIADVSITEDIYFPDPKIIILAVQNCTNFSAYGPGDTPANTVEFYINSSYIQYSATTNKTISDIGYNDTSDMWIFTGNGTDGQLNITACVEHLGTDYGLFINDNLNLTNTSQAGNLLYYEFSSWSQHDFSIQQIDTTFTVTLPVGYTQGNFSPVNSTATNESPDGQTDSVPWFNVTNTGNGNLEVRLVLNNTLVNVVVKADTDNNPSGAAELSTNLQSLCGSVSPSSSCDIWLWCDYNHAIPQTSYRECDVNVTQ